MTGASKKGRRMPPAQTRFKPGQSGNPEGRPKGSKNLKTVLEQELGKVVTMTENGRQVRRSKLELVVQRVTHDSIKGNHRATGLLLDAARSLDAADSAVSGQAQGSDEAADGRMPDKAALKRILRRFDHLKGEDA